MNPLFLIKTRKGNPILLFSLLGIALKKLFRKDFNSLDFSDVPIDVIIPTVTKDYDLLASVVDSLAHVEQKVDKVFIISKNEQQIKDFCSQHGLYFIDENSVLGYGKNAISYTVDGIDRSGWIFQQLLKLSGDTISDKNNYLVLDSDTVLIRDFSFIKKDGAYVMQQSYEWHDRYFKTYAKLFKKKPINTFSSISHMMLFNKNLVQAMKKEIEAKNNLPWDKAILALIDNTDGSFFSEYESYANFTTAAHPEKIAYIPFYNTAYKRSEMKNVLSDTSSYAKKYNSLSFHDYIN